MRSAPEQIILNNPTPAVLLAVREFLSRNPCAARFGAETISRLLYEDRYLSYCAAVHEVEYALEALFVEGEVLA